MAFDQTLPFVDKRQLGKKYPEPPNLFQFSCRLFHRETRAVFRRGTSGRRPQPGKILRRDAEALPAACEGAQACATQTGSGDDEAEGGAGPRASDTLRDSEACVDPRPGDKLTSIGPSEERIYSCRISAFTERASWGATSGCCSSGGWAGRWLRTRPSVSMRGVRTRLRRRNTVRSCDAIFRPRRERSEPALRRRTPMNSTI